MLLCGKGREKNRGYSEEAVKPKRESYTRFFICRFRLFCRFCLPWISQFAHESSLRTKPERSSSREKFSPVLQIPMQRRSSVKSIESRNQFTYYQPNFMKTRTHSSPSRFHSRIFSLPAVLIRNHAAFQGQVVGIFWFVCMTRLHQELKFAANPVFALNSIWNSEALVPSRSFGFLYEKLWRNMSPFLGG